MYVIYIYIYIYICICMCGGVCIYQMDEDSGEEVEYNKQFFYYTEVSESALTNAAWAKPLLQWSKYKCVVVWCSVLSCVAVCSSAL